MMNTKEPAHSLREQLHGTGIATIKSRDQHPADGDVLITQLTDTPLVIRLADCGGVMLFDPVTRTIANIHAGWRGTAQKVIARTITTLVDRFHVSREDLRACIAPTIGPCCLVFSDPENELPAFMHPYILEENYVDLWGALEGQLRGSGVAEENIENARLCTFCNPELFYSYRRDRDETARFGTAIMLK